MHLEAQNLSVSFPDTTGGTLAAVGPVNFEIEEGTFVALLGPSGCGKSTLIRVFAGLQKATGGSARLNGIPIHEPEKAVALMFQDATLMPWRSVRDNIALPLELSGFERKDRYRQVEKYLMLLGLEGFADAYPGQLSGGMAQRAALGRVLIQHPGVLLLDEPFGALDAMTRERMILDLLAIWAIERQTVVMVTHDIQEAVLMADRILVLSNRPGRIVADLHVDLARPRTPGMIYTAAFTAIARQVRDAISPV